MSRLWLIRHGRTEANDRHLYCGSTDLPLSEAGRQALSGLRYAIAPERILTSGMARTEETLELLLGPVPHEVCPAFREIDFGDFEMKSYEELKEDPAYLAWITGDNDSNVPPNGESGNQMTERVFSALDRVLETGKDTLIVTHGGVIAAIMSRLFPEEARSRYAWQPKPGCGYQISGQSYRPIP